MNVFEDLIGELKEENLLEDTVIAVARHPNEHASAAAEESADDKLSDEFAQIPEVPNEDNEADFYRKRAIGEVSNLQMVEHVISGVERIHMKLVPATYDDLEVKKALHKFLQVSVDPTAPGYVQAEYALLRETQTWFTALAERDKKISVANIRRFCETSRPVLSSQALIALAQFYRNSPFSEDVRGKFDFVMTRLFSRDSGEEKRRLLFSRVDMLTHINALYANWSSIALFAPGEKEAEILNTIGRLGEKIEEAESAHTFQDLIDDDFFGKIHLLKETAQEMFFVPEIVAAAIECNVRVGNKFVDLVRLERDNGSARVLEEKYGYSYDLVVSQAAGKTMHLLELLKEVEEFEENVPVADPVEVQANEVVLEAAAAKVAPAPSRRGTLDVNKWLLMATIVVIALSSAVYLWSENMVPEPAAGAVARQVSIDDDQLKLYLRTVRATDSALYAVAFPSFDSLSEKEQKDILMRALELAKKNRLNRVQLMNHTGRNVGFASDSKMTLTPQ